MIGFQSISRDISERKRIEAEREQLIDDLDAYSRMVAHDLKAPLATLSLRSQMLSSSFERLSAQQRQDSVQSIQEISMKMGQIVDALLPAGKGKQGR